MDGIQSDQILYSAPAFSPARALKLMRRISFGPYPFTQILGDEAPQTAPDARTLAPRSASERTELYLALHCAILHGLGAMPEGQQNLVINLTKSYNDAILSIADSQRRAAGPGSNHVTTFFHLPGWPGQIGDFDLADGNGSMLSAAFGGLSREEKKEAMGGGEVKFGPQAWTKAVARGCVLHVAHPRESMVMGLPEWIKVDLANGAVRIVDLGMMCEQHTLRNTTFVGRA